MLNVVCIGRRLKTDHLDASLLGLVNMHYLDPKQEKARQHLAMLEENLACGDGLFYRYKHADDFGKPQVAFLLCAFLVCRGFGTHGANRQGGR